ncbi:DUF2336 domain-containing protein [uncultured Roseibium sp.]|uniref:DUF2336 domain-containing protein n=1 Tax=uncultured Roseibium sp. TaxID=1936171 RepID=UPI0025950D52|nr:DUF2336 domain-containing protein [uncultured Roseibium sp.]
MIIHDFLNWVETAPDGPRAEAAGALARAWLYSELDDDSRKGASAALTVLLDDPCVDVRMAIAHNLCRSSDAPRHILLSLAEDRQEVASIVLETSPLFSDVDLIDVLANPQEDLQRVVASRRELSAAVSAAIAEIGTESACRALLSNNSANIVPTSLLRLAERFEDVADLREALLKRPDLPMHMRHALLLRHARSIGETAGAAGERDQNDDENLLADASDKIALRLVHGASHAELLEMSEYLRASGHLNTRLLLRAVCCGRFRFFATALALLSGVPEERIFRALIAARPSALRAVMRKAGLPMRSHQAFLLAIDMAREGGADLTADLPLDLARMLTECLLGELQDEALGADGDILAFLRRFALEVARLEARAYIHGTAQRALRAA